MENRNYKSDVDQSFSSKRKTFDVNGMTCASCASTVQKTLARLEGVTSAEVDLEDSSAAVVYDPAIVTPEEMQKAVEHAGYELGTKDSRKRE
ncbi:MAG: heavy metal-associated domain-containing protein [Fulvivirga sp.]